MRSNDETDFQMAKKVVTAAQIYEQFKKQKPQIMCNQLLNELEIVDSYDEDEDDLFLIFRITNYHRIEFQQNFRISRNAFNYLIGRHASYVDECNTNNLKISLEKQLLAVVGLLATPESYRSVGERFDLAKSTLSMIYIRVVNFLNKIASSIIKFPSSEERLIISNYFEHKYKLKGIVGVIDGTYIPVKAPSGQNVAYTNRKGFTTVTLQGVSACVLHNICLDYKDDIEVNMYIEHGLEYARGNIVPEERDMEIAIAFAGSAERNRIAAELWRRRRETTTYL
ncbi:hypothetical protein NQ314_003527 [Rhamnusium bicolor]|uniref:Nuclease HARBI1 n=1 Tax=Rhamnusium bicolor TaxID=1586634 RepID=A0AAV8ZNF3_9CUCU|nr:hypothetical protein NQ314_003527 [Rhamnusium bicolor]